MFLELDLKQQNAIAVIDDSGASLSFGELNDFSNQFYSQINKRTLIFLLSENVVGALAGYVASLSKEIVPLVLSCHTDRELAFKMLLSALSDSANPVPCEYKACTYDDFNQGILKAMYNNLVRDIFDSSIAGKASDAIIGKQLKDLNEKIIDNDSALQFK